MAQHLRVATLSWSNSSRCSLALRDGLSRLEIWSATYRVRSRSQLHYFLFHWCAVMVSFLGLAGYCTGNNCAGSYALSEACLDTVLLNSDVFIDSVSGDAMV